MRFALCAWMLFAVIPLTVKAPILGSRKVAQRPSTIGVTFSYSLSAEHISLHEPVILVFSVKNNLKQGVDLDLGVENKGGFSFILRKPDGTKLQLPIFVREGFSTRTGKLLLNPGQGFSQDLLLNEWYEFSSPGKYELEGHLVNPFKVDAGSRYETDPGFHITLEIGPRDERALTTACESLANRIGSTRSYQEAADATLALSYIGDPVAVPYLLRAALAGKLVERIAINGLEKIGNDEAVRALAEILKAPSDASTLARNSLLRIQKKTADPNLLREIDSALAGNL